MFKTTHNLSKQAFSTHFLLQLQCFAENTINCVFRRNSFSKTQLVKPTFSPMSKTLFFFFQKRCHFWFWAISVETTVFIVFTGFHCFGPSNFLAQTGSVHENVRFFLPSDTNRVRQFLLRIHFFSFSHFWMTNLKNPVFIGVFGIFPFFCFSCST